MTLLETTETGPGTARPSQYAVYAMMSLAMCAGIVVWALFDSRTIEGAYVWMKPFKFAFSSLVLFATIVLIERRLSPGWTSGWTLRLNGWLMGAAFLAENLYIIYQAAQARTSHFNLSTPFEAFMYMTVMAGGAVALVIGIAVVGVVAWLDKGARLSPVLREGIALGCLLSFGLTLGVAGYMSGTLDHFVGVHPEGAPTMGILGWSGVTGDLRPAHFVALHAMQVLPLLALVLERRGRPDALGVLRVAAIGYAGLTLAVFQQALMGLPLIPLG